MAVPGFASDVRNLFRDSDVATMKRYHIDLSKYEDVKARAADIYARLVDGDMPCRATPRGTRTSYVSSKSGWTAECCRDSTRRSSFRDRGEKPRGFFVSAVEHQFAFAAKRDRMKLEFGHWRSEVG